MTTDWEAHVAALEPLDAGTGVPAQTVAAELAALAGLDVGEHPDVYQRIHAGLQAALAAIDDA